MEQMILFRLGGGKSRAATCVKPHDRSAVFGEGEQLTLPCSQKLLNKSRCNVQWPKASYPPRCDGAARHVSKSVSIHLSGGAV